MANSGIHSRVWRNGVVERDNFPFEQVSDYLEQPDTLVWADLVSPDQSTLSQLAEELSLDPLAIEDALENDERPKAKRYPTHVFVTAYSLRRSPDGTLAVGRFSVFLTGRGFVTIRLDDSVDMAEVVTRWQANEELLKYGSRALLHGLLDVVVDHYDDEMQRLDDAVQQIEDSLFDEDNPPDGRDVSQRTFALRRSLTVARRAILPMREVVTNVMRGNDGAAAGIAPYYEDLYDHVLRAAEQTESLRDTITSIFQANMQVADHNMNVIMKQLTSWAAIIAVPTAVTGYFGQNIPYPGFAQPWGFWTSVGVIVGLAVVLYVSFKRRGWL